MKAAWTMLLGVVMVACNALDPDDNTIGGTGRCGPSSAPPDLGSWSPTAAAFEQRVLELTNQRRANGGCCGSRCFAPAAALAVSSNLRAAARLHARDMAREGYFSHDSRDGRTVLQRVRSAGFGGCAVGENIAQGQPTPEAVVDAWMGSPGHCQNMLAPQFTALGVGYVDDPEASLRRLWVQNFGDQ
jgi:uncharacterized protein YkwD